LHAHELDAERAVQAGLELVEEVPKLTTVAGVPLQVRVGIATVRDSSAAAGGCLDCDCAS